ncbi:MAG TPA: response regulator transcription factor [Puia sp.]|nr:response regulator transcription factor [Puia sp.]
MLIRVAIFEDNRKFLDALSLFIGSVPELELTGAFGDTGDLRGKMAESDPDVVLMDIGIVPLDGIEATRWIMGKHPRVKVLMQTVFDDDSKVFAAICAGASGYVLKTAQLDVLLPYILDVYEGGAAMSPTIAGKTLRLFRDHFQAGEKYADYKLSAREKEVLKYLVDGYSYKMIADRCHVSFETIKTYIKRIYEKLHVASMTEAVVKALKENLV